MEDLKLIKPNMDFEKQVLEMVQEFYEDGSNPYGSSGIKKYSNNYKGRLKYLKECENGNIIRENIVPASQYILIREFDNKVIGFISVRHRLNDPLLEHGGHIGYSIRPSERRKHYALGEVFAVLNIFRDLGIEKILAICDKSNIGSIRIIEDCGGVLENEIIDPTDGELIQRYWIDTKEGIEKGKKFFKECEFDIIVI